MNFIVKYLDENRKKQQTVIYAETESEAGVKALRMYNATEIISVKKQ